MQRSLAFYAKCPLCPKKVYGETKNEVMRRIKIHTSLKHGIRLSNKDIKVEKGYSRLKPGVQFNPKGSKILGPRDEKNLTRIAEMYRLGPDVTEHLRGLIDIALKANIAKTLVELNRSRRAALSAYRLLSIYPKPEATAILAVVSNKMSSAIAERIEKLIPQLRKLTPYEIKIEADCISEKEKEVIGKLLRYVNLPETTYRLINITSHGTEAMEYILQPLDVYRYRIARVYLRIYSNGKVEPRLLTIGQATSFMREYM